MQNLWGGMMGYGGMSFVFWVTALLVWTALVLVIIALVRWLNRK